MSDRIYTRKGDSGETSLLGVARVGKDAARVETYGTIDEATSTLGLARASTPYRDTFEVILGLQGELIEVMASCATMPDAGTGRSSRITPAMIQGLENLIDRYTEEWIQTGKFARPGGSQASAALDMARTVVRRGERRLVSLSREAPVEPEVFQYLNRLSDLLYVMARVEEQRTIKDMVEIALKTGGKEMQTGTTELPLAVCDQAVEAGIRRSLEIGVPMALAVTDREGTLIELKRMDNALAVSLELAPRKAYTAAAVRMPTQELSRLAAANGPLYGIEANLPRVTLIGGGLPLEKNGRVIGAVGVSGGTVEQDIDVAKAMAEAVT